VSKAASADCQVDTLLERSLTASARRYFQDLPGGGAMPPGPDVRCGEAGTVAVGTQVRFHVAVNAGVVTAARFQAYGCPHTLAVCAWLTERLVGQAALADDFARQPLVGGPHAWAREMGVPPEKLGRLLLVEDALNAALSQGGTE